MVDFIDHHFALWIILLQAAIFLCVAAGGCLIGFLLRDRALVKYYILFGCLGFIVIIALSLILYFCGAR